MKRVSGANGLPLSPHVDKLVDRHWISFDSEGQQRRIGRCCVVEGTGQEALDEKPSDPSTDTSSWSRQSPRALQLQRGISAGVIAQLATVIGSGSLYWAGQRVGCGLSAEEGRQETKQARCGVTGRRTSAAAPVG